MTAFFVPDVAPEEVEATYARYAKWCSVPTPPIEQRVRSITFIHDGEEWMATVGEQLKGLELVRPKRRRDAWLHGARLSDPAFVLAIFAGFPWRVVTNHRLIEPVGSRWENPFFTGEPQRIVRFV